MEHCGDEHAGYAGTYIDLDEFRESPEKKAETARIIAESMRVIDERPATMERLYFVDLAGVRCAVMAAPDAVPFVMKS